MKYSPQLKKRIAMLGSSWVLRVSTVCWPVYEASDPRARVTRQARSQREFHGADLRESRLEESTRRVKCDSTFL